jgi:hypothetical protein
MKTQYTKEQLAEFLTQPEERFYRRYCEESRKELWEQFQKEKNEIEKTKIQTETVSS